MKRVHPWVDLSRSDEVGLSQGGSEAAMLCWSFTVSSFFLALFLLSVMSTMTFNDPSHFFQKRKLYYASWTIEKQFSIRECVHLWMEWSGGKLSSAELGEQSDKLQRGARMPGQRRGGQLVLLYLSKLKEKRIWLGVIPTRASLQSLDMWRVPLVTILARDMWLKFLTKPRRSCEGRKPRE